MIPFWLVTDWLLLSHIGPMKLNMHRWHITPILATITSPSLSLAPGQGAQQQHQFYCRIIQEHPLVPSLNAATMRSKCMNFRFHFQVYLFTSYLFSENFSLHMTICSLFMVPADRMEVVATMRGGFSATALTAIFDNCHIL
jgi:hypothetical protein